MRSKTASSSQSTSRSVPRLPGISIPKATAENDQGRVAPTLQLSYVTLTFTPSASQKAELTQLLADQQNPNSPNYHRWLTPEEYADRFGVTQDDMTQDHVVAAEPGAHDRQCCAGAKLGRGEWLGSADRNGVSDRNPSISGRWRDAFCQCNRTFGARGNRGTRHEHSRSERFPHEAAQCQAALQLPKPLRRSLSCAGRSGHHLRHNGRL